MLQQKVRLGQATSEYAITITLIVLLALGGLGIIGGNVSGLLSVILPPRPAADKAVSVQATTLHSSTSGGYSQASPSQSLTVTLPDGTELRISDYPTNLKQSIETLGANGTTSLLLGALDSVIRQLREHGKITPEEASLLSQVANQGHKIAEVQRIAEGAIANCPDSKCFEQAKAMYDGKQYGVRDLTYKLAWFDTGKEGAMIVQLRALQEQAIAGGALSDPVSLQVVGTLIEQIANIANGVETASGQIQVGLREPADFYATVAEKMYERDDVTGSNTMQGLQDFAFSTGTDAKSAAICSVGGGTDSGTACTP